MTAIAFRLRPAEHEKLKDACRGNRSDLIRKWAAEYLANPVPLANIDDNLKQTTIAVDPALADKLAAQAKLQGVSLMVLMRQLVEHKLRERG